MRSIKEVLEGLGYNVEDGTNQQGAGISQYVPSNPVAALVAGVTPWGLGEPATHVWLMVPDDGEAQVEAALGALRLEGYTAVSDPACGLGHFNVLDAVAVQ